jgi:hypothetical protein
MGHELGDPAGNASNHRHHARRHRLQQGDGQPLEIGHQQDCLGFGQPGLHLGGRQGAGEGDRFGEAGIGHLPFAGGTGIAIADQGGPDGPV